MLKENIKQRPLSGKFPILKNNFGEKPKIFIQSNNNIKEKKNLLDKKIKEDKLDTKLYTKTFAESKENNNTSINQITDKTEFLEMISKQKESDKEALDNIITNEVNRIKNVNEKRKKLNEINLIEKNYDDLYLWENLFNNSRPLSHYTTLKKRKIKKLEENKGLEEFKSPIILVDLHEDQMNLYFGKNNFIQNEGSKKKIRSAKEKYLTNNNKSINKNNKNQKQLSTNTNIKSNNISSLKNNLKSNTLSHNNSVDNTLKSKKSTSARNRIMSSINTKRSLKSRDKSFHKHIRPMSVYSPRVNTCSFYFSNTFSDYYKEDLKSFSEKMKILKAKVKSNPAHLKQEIKLQRKISNIKEKRLDDIINSNKYFFDKEDLIIAADRKNPVPLLRSIFRTNYPDKEVMKENIKNYYNTMKPLGNSDQPVDYTKNERWGFIEKFNEMRNGGKKDYNNVRNIGKNKNLILKYYKENDPYILMFEKMVKNKKAKIKDLVYFQEENDSDKRKHFNPILNVIEDISPFLNEKDNKIINIENIREETNKKNIENKPDINIRPKTGFKSVASHIDSNFYFYLNSTRDIKRPQTSNVKEINFIENNYYVPYSNLEYKSKSFPIKTSSNVGNVSYDKMNQMLQERHLGLSKVKKDYFMTSTGQIKNKEKQMKYKEEKIILPKSKKNKKIIDIGEISDLGVNKGQESGITPRDKKNWTEEYFQNFRRKYYSSSNNTHIKNKRKNKAELLNKYYTQSQYSNDEPEIEFIDRSVSSQTNSMNRKI